ncbi:transcriptional regulator, GntR family with aminotransferase domain [Catenulispora acidiphila DSM 44928]|uniref:Transcriptional regulator, GntR family with aminotransferase domain n=1 Tax=Catenulispora acidiphila (strain DSM 44928 / JCM 14897 / NBRC 102108 / NRRL B-24433 / ID139908) TaxID=479433 RepID=C7QGT2_CATAD|nr:PLP-dependent aminotransferase family protein [Catenulispora acidiphila]ACU74962.1 transcriptional regulator, GntR family with aminotransferase domain [Catenulispora acidiphila DSM 44928]
MADTQTNLAWETLLDLSTTRPGPLHHQLAEAIRTAIRGGRLPLGSALPPSRVLATDLGVSRWTVTEAYGQLATEGFLAGKTGSATRVSWSPEPDERRAVVHSHPGHADPRRHLPVRYDFSQCTPDFRAFPRRKWVEAIRTAAETAPFDRLGYAQPGGEPRLRGILADHLNRRRGTNIDPALMTVFTGAKAAMGALARALYAEGHRLLAIEDPGSNGMWEPARAAGLELVPLPVDERGIVAEALAEHPGVRAVCIGPAHQVVNGAELAPERRSWLLEWASRVDGLVIEDDYDSEFSYDRPALPAMQGTDPRRVALIGSMSRTMTPTVNVGWAVVPGRWLTALRPEPWTAPTAPALNQLALAHFIESGSYDRHLRTSRQRFRTRRDALVAALEQALPGARVSGQQAGLHMLLELPPGASATRVMAAALRHEIELCDLNLLRMAGDPDTTRLMVGYGNLADAQVTAGVAALVELIREAGGEG